MRKVNVVCKPAVAENLSKFLRDKSWDLSCYKTKRLEGVREEVARPQPELGTIVGTQTVRARPLVFIIISSKLRLTLSVVSTRNLSFAFLQASLLGLVAIYSRCTVNASVVSISNEQCSQSRESANRRSRIKHRVSTQTKWFGIALFEEGCSNSSTASGIDLHPFGYGRRRAFHKH